MEDIITVEKIAVVANGAIEDYTQIAPFLEGYDQYIAVDGGLDHCVALGLTPSLLFGDMDSVTFEARKKFSHLKEVKFNREKDETDLELALNFLMKKDPKSITVFAGLGNRVDHSLFNLILLTRYPGKLFLETEEEILGAIDQTLEIETYKGQLFSLIPINGPVMGITTDGLKWQLKNKQLDKSFVGVSNEATGSSIYITVKEGDLIFSIHKKLGRGSRAS